MTPLDWYYIAAQIVGAAAAFVLGLTRIRWEKVQSAAVVLGVVTNLAVQLPEGGPGLCLGMVVLPAVFLAVAFVGRGIRTALIMGGILADQSAAQNLHGEDRSGHP